MSAGRAIALDDFRSMTSPEMGRLMARFAANHADGGDGDGAADAAEADALAAQLATVPAGFFETDFALRDASPAFGHAGDAPDGAARAAHGEELGGYLDVVEGQLVGQLGRSSDEFFRALGNFQELWARVRETCGEVKDLRTRIRDMQCEAVQGTMRVPRLACKQSNLVALQSKVRLMRDVVRASEKARELMLAEDFPETCRVIAAARKTLDGELKGVECLRHTAHHLAQFQELAVSYMGNEWSAYAVASSWEAREAPPAPPGLAGPDLLLAKAAGRRAARVGALQPLVRGLVANGKMGSVLAKYAQRCDDDFKERARRRRPFDLARRAAKKRIVPSSMVKRTWPFLGKPRRKTQGAAGASAPRETDDAGGTSEGEKENLCPACKTNLLDVSATALGRQAHVNACLDSQSAERRKDEGEE